MPVSILPDNISTAAAAASVLSNMPGPAKATKPGLSPSSSLIIGLAACGAFALVGFVGLLLHLARNDYGHWCFPLCRSSGWARDKTNTQNMPSEDEEASIGAQNGSISKGPTSSSAVDGDTSSNCSGLSHDSSDCCGSTASSPANSSAENTLRRPTFAKLRAGPASVCHSLLRRSDELANATNIHNLNAPADLTGPHRASFDTAKTANSDESFRHAPRILDTETAQCWLAALTTFPPPPPSSYLPPAASARITIPTSPSTVSSPVSPRSRTSLACTLSLVPPPPIRVEVDFNDERAIQVDRDTSPLAGSKLAIVTVAEVSVHTHHV
ncbi:hypothetical protein CspeluHIS016_0104740 [Cutaneotrichosporon spelunceum]|uniref:Uncharacterized protein n=1 Tax=Cutaneotrichosporon spelunceum TaxID=1672016 RepID=A0AAD3Y9E7_9TREE|nr:hypothetical protein CspeluHIS016_0104740 [Cutaneotrichosporon spelunceum]